MIWPFCASGIFYNAPFPLSPIVLQRNGFVEFLQVSALVVLTKGTPEFSTSFCVISIGNFHKTVVIHILDQFYSFMWITSQRTVFSAPKGSKFSLF